MIFCLSHASNLTYFVQGGFYNELDQTTLVSSGSEIEMRCNTRRRVESNTCPEWRAISFSHPRGFIRRIGSRVCDLVSRAFVPFAGRGEARKGIGPLSGFALARLLCRIQEKGADVEARR